MKKIISFVVLSIFGYSAIASTIPVEAILDKVAFQVSAKDWVSTESALLKININATLNNADLVKARAEILENLNKITKGEWHLTQFDRSEDNSGLEKLFVMAEAKVPQADLTDVYTNAKNVSKPGATYEVSAIDFKPGLVEIEKVKANLRQMIYKKINDELAAVNASFNKQQYSLNRVVFYENEEAFESRVPQGKMMMNTMVMAAARAPAPLAVSNEVILHAYVELAANRQGNTVASQH